MIPNTKEVAAARRNKDRANEALRLDPFNQDRAAAVIAAHARMADATIQAMRQPPPAPKTPPAPKGPHPRHQENATHWQARADELRADLDRAEAKAASANYRAKRLTQQLDQYTTAEIVEAQKAAAAEALTVQRTTSKFLRATHKAAKSAALAAGLPIPIPEKPETSDHAKRLARWKRAERELIRRVQFWQDHLDRVAAELENPGRMNAATQDRKAAWEARCNYMLDGSTTRLAVYRRDHGLPVPANPPPADDDLETDEHGRFIL